MNYLIGGSMLAFAAFVTLCFGIIFAVMSYRGFLGMALWKWTRIPFAYAGSILLSIGMHGVPALPTREDEYEKPEDEIQNLQAKDERGEVEGAEPIYRRWVFDGLTPKDVQNSCVAQAYGSHAPDKEFDEVEFEPKETILEFKQRRAMERAS